MAHVVDERRPADRWGRADTRARPFVAVIVLVGITVAGVLLARGALSSDTPGGALAWLTIAIVLTLAGIHYIRGLGRDHASSAQAAPVVVLRREGAAKSADARRHRRFVPARRGTTLHMRDGRQIPARIIDISIAGVSVEARLSDFDMLAVERVGARPAGPVRRTPVGAVFGFETLLDPQPFDASFVL